MDNFYLTQRGIAQACWYYGIKNFIPDMISLKLDFDKYDFDWCKRNQTIVFEACVVYLLFIRNFSIDREKAFLRIDKNLPPYSVLFIYGNADKAKDCMIVSKRYEPITGLNWHIAKTIKELNFKNNHKAGKQKKEL